MVARTYAFPKWGVGWRPESEHGGTLMTVTSERTHREKWPVDLINAGSLLSDEEKRVRDRVREFVDREVIPDAADYWDRAQFPFGLLPGLGELGLMGGTLPEDYGCAGWNNVDDGHTRVGLGGAEAALAAAYGQVREDRLFRADRTRSRKRPWLFEHYGRRERRRLRAERGEEVDRQRLLLGLGGDLGQDRRRQDLRFPRRDQESRLPGRHLPPQGLPARRLA